MLNCCIYCASKATCKDHVLPVSSWNVKGLDHLKFEVWSCKTCNCVASDKVFFSFESKINWLFNKAVEQERINKDNIEKIIEYRQKLIIKINSNVVSSWITLIKRGICANCGALIYNRKHKRSRYCSHYCMNDLRKKVKIELNSKL